MTQSRRRNAWVLAALLPLLGLAATLLTADGWPTVMVCALIAVTGTVALLILRRHPTHRIGWLLAFQSLFLCIVSPGDPGTSRAAMVGVQLLQGGWVLMLVCLVLIAYLFPSGHALSRRWRAWIRMFLTAYAVFLVVATSDAQSFASAFPGQEPPLPLLPQALAGVAGVVSMAFIVASLGGAVICARQRFRRAVGDERLQLLWFTGAVLSLPTTALALWLLHFAIEAPSDLATYTVIAVGLSVLPLGIGIAIMRLRLFDIELVLSRALTYGALTVAVLSVYGLALFATGGLLGHRSIGGLLAVALVAVAVNPAHGLLRRRIERAIYGYRSEPHEALRLLAQRADAADPLQLTATITHVVAEALRVDRAWVEQAGESPREGAHVVRVPLVHRGTRLGELAVEVPRSRELSPADTALMDDLARHVAVMVRADQLNHELQQSRSRLVTAREEERRRLRRDLHDGLGPLLAAIVLKLNAAESRTDATERNALLAETRDETKAAIAEVRRLVDDLRPPAIDEVGLLGAIRQRVAALSGNGLTVEVLSSQPLPPLSAAVEVAAFRIAAEAVTNVARHSGASRCVVEVTTNGAFELTVTDNGTGPATEMSRGVGWSSMAERAAELGGACTISARAEGGLVVRAVLPLADLETAT